MNTPKARLLADKSLAKDVQEVVDSAVLQTAADTSLLEMLNDLPDTTNPAESIAYYNRLVGARDFLRKLAVIADRPKPAPPVPSPNLNYKV